MLHKTNIAVQTVAALWHPQPIFTTLDDSAFQASSSWRPNTDGVNHFPKNSRLHTPAYHSNVHCWHRGDGANDIQWLQVNLGQPYLITEIQTRGRTSLPQHIQRYGITYVELVSNNIVSLPNLSGGTEFDANYDSGSVVSNKYFQPFVTQLVKIHPLMYQGNMCLNWEIVGVPLASLKAAATGASAIDFSQFAQMDAK